MPYAFSADLPPLTSGTATQAIRLFIVDELLFHRIPLEITLEPLGDIRAVNRAHGTMHKARIGYGYRTILTALKKSFICPTL